MSQKFLKIKGLLINVMKTSEGLVVWLRLDGHLWCVQASQQQKEIVEERYSKHKEVVRDLQQQLDESKRRMQEYKV